MSALASRIRGVRTALASGVLWITFAWLLVGLQVREALGLDCLNVAHCAQARSDLADLVVSALDALGPAAGIALLTFTAAIVGGAINVILALVLGIRWPWIVNLLMDWASPGDLSDHGERSAEWDEALRVGAEGITRLVLLPPAMGIIVVLGLRSSSLWYLLLALLLAVGLHGLLALRRYRQMIAEIEEEQQEEEQEKKPDVS